MTRVRQIIGGVLVLALTAAPALAAPKKQTHKKPVPRAAVTFPAESPYVSSFNSYDVGTLTMTGRTPADTTYSIGPLRFIGRSVGAARYNIGTSSITGRKDQ